MRSADIKPGVQIGTLTVVAKTVKTLSSGRRMPGWSLRCDCGKIVVAMTVNLTKGKHMSCGCKRAELTSAHYRGDTKRPEYSVYRQMLDRCYLNTAPNFPWYGAKGVTVCDRWRFGEEGETGFGCFIADMGSRPDGLTLDRIYPFQPYSADNCRWATWTEQASNKREHYLPPLELAALRKRRRDGYRGENAPNAKITDRQAAAIKARMAEGAKAHDLARAFGIAVSTVYGIASGRKRSEAAA